MPWKNSGLRKLENLSLPVSTKLRLKIFMETLTFNRRWGKKRNSALRRLYKKNLSWQQKRSRASFPFQLRRTEQPSALPRIEWTWVIEAEG